MDRLPCLPVLKVVHTRIVGPQPIAVHALLFVRPYRGHAQEPFHLVSRPLAQWCRLLRSRVAILIERILLG